MLTGNTHRDDKDDERGGNRKWTRGSVRLFTSFLQDSEMKRERKIRGREKKSMTSVGDLRDPDVDHNILLGGKKTNDGKKTERKKKWMNLFQQLREAV